MRSKAHCEKIIEDGAQLRDCRDGPRNKVPFVPPPPMHSPSRGASAECDRRFSSLRLGNARLGGIGCGLFSSSLSDPDKGFTDTRIHRAPDCAITWRDDI